MTSECSAERHAGPVMIVLMIMAATVGTSTIAWSEEGEGREPASAVQTHAQDVEARDDVDDHDHSQHDYVPTRSAAYKAIKWLGRFHPAMTHFPIGLLVAAAVAELLLIISDNPMFDDAALFCVWFGMATALIAAPLGWSFGGFRLVDSDWVLLTHRWLGTGTAAWSLLVVWLSRRSHRQSTTSPMARRLYRAALFIGAGLVTATGFFGGSLIYGIDHFLM